MPSTILPWGEPVEREDVFILDTETTGRGERAEIIEIALIDITGKERCLSLCRPEKLTPITAMRALSGNLTIRLLKLPTEERTTKFKYEQIQ